MTPWTTVHQASLSMGFFQVRILEWVAISSSRGDLPYPGTEPISPASPALAGAFFITVPPGKHHYIPSVQFSSVAQSCLTHCDPMNCSTPGLPVHHQLPEFTQTHVHQVSDAIQPSHPPLSPSPPAPNPSQHQRDSNDFANESTLRMRWPKYWSFSFSIIPSKQIPGLPSFRMDWLDLLA